MTAIVSTREQISELFQSILEEEKYSEQLELPEGVDELAYEHYAEMQAAMLDALGVPRGKDFRVEVSERAVQLVQEKVKRYACDFIKATYLLLGDYGCTGEARDFALMIMAATGGNSKQLIILSDEKLEQLTGHSTRTIRRRRAAFRAWEQKTGWTVIEIHEQKRNPQTKHIPPTEYRVHLGDIVCQFIREWRSYYQKRAALFVAPDRVDEEQPPELWDDLKAERERAAFAETTKPETVRRISTDLMERNPNQPVPPRKIGYRHTPNQRRDELEIINMQVLNFIARGRDVARRRGMPARSWWDGIKRKAAVILDAPTEGVREPEEE